jgi:hypothetical protein
VPTKRVAPNLRKDKRKPITAEGMVYDTRGKPLVAVTVTNVSIGGAQLELETEVELPSFFSLALTRSTNVRRPCKRIWQFATVAGVSFHVDRSA